MTFTEAAVEVLRRAGKPLHYKEIAENAVNGGMLSHVGQMPEATMGARLVSMAKREHDRKVIALDSGVFGLSEWGLPAPAAPVAPPVLEPPVDEKEPQYRARERHPPLRAEMTVGGRRDDRHRRGDDEDGQRKKRYQPPSDVAWQWLRERGQPASLADIATGLRENDRIAEALQRDLGSLEKALREENRRRRDTRSSPMFEFLDDGTVKALEPQREQPRERQQRPEQRPRREEGRPAGAEEQKRSVVRSVRRRLGSLDAAALERLVHALLEAQGYSQLHMARRSTREGPFYLARRKWGSSELRYAIRVLLPGREIGRNEVQDVRRDLQHYSAQVAVVFGAADCVREAKSEGNVPNQAPVMLYGGEALAEALVDAGLGVSKRLIEWFEYDDEFFASMGAGELLPEVVGEEPTPVEQQAGEESAAGREEPDDSRRRGRDRSRGRGRRFREGQEQRGTSSAAPAPEAATIASEMPTAADMPVAEEGSAAAAEPAAPTAPPEIAAVPVVEREPAPESEAPSAPESAAAPPPVPEQES